METITLKGPRVVAVERRHPWVFSGAIARMSAQPAEGDRVAVCTPDGRVLGYGHYQEGSIRVRLIDFGEAPPAAGFWRGRLAEALDVRRQLGLASGEETTAYRLVHAEGDGLPGLIIDVYGGTAVVQCHSWGMYREREAISAALREVYGDGLEAVYLKSATTLPQRFRAEAEDGYLYGQAPGNRVRENGRDFLVDWEGGQKTGFFLDQRDNRALLARYAPGRTVLNTFCYTGGFSVYALAAGASRVDSVDVSAPAMEMTARNVALTGRETDHQGHTADMMAYLREQERTWDIVVVDPPAFAKTVAKRHNGVQGYKRLNAAALQRVRPGGLLFTFSCSQVVDRELFYNTIVAAGLEVGRPVRVLHHLTQGADHPVSLFHPEGAYLKGLVLRVG